ncbi:MAG: DUF2878 domain-containing protein [Desulfuromonadales bacterium]
MSSGASKIINLILYELGWGCCVLGAAWGYPLAGGGLALIPVLMHLWLVEDRRREIRLMLIAMMLGLLIDGGQQLLGLLRFKPDGLDLILPLWVFVIWAQFATLFRFALSWLSSRYLLAVLFGAIGGPVAYGGGIQLGAAEFGPHPLFALIVLAVIWASVVPFLIWISGRNSTSPGNYRRLFAW